MKEAPDLYTPNKHRTLGLGLHRVPVSSPATIVWAPVASVIITLAIRRAVAKVTFFDLAKIGSSSLTRT